MTVVVLISAEEQAAAGLGNPEVTYANADGVVDDDGCLLIRQQYTVLAEYPLGRYVSWHVVEEEEG